MIRSRSDDRDRRAGCGFGRAGSGSDQVHDPLGDESLYGKRLLLHALAEVQFELLVQQPRSRPDPDTGKAPKDLVKVYQPGFRIGGPIQIPGLYDGHDKAFFFFNYEEFRQPSQVSRTRRILTPSAQQGLFSYGSQTINVLSVAAANGQTATADPTIKKLLADIYGSTTAGTLQARSDPNTLDFNYTADAKQLRHYPTWRLDYNLSANHRLSYASYFQPYSSFPDTLNNAEARFPGFPVAGEQNSKRWNWNIQERSTLGKNLVNQFVTGYTASHVFFFTQITPDKFGGRATIW